MIQRWQRGLVEAREAAARANEDAACRRWAVQKLHKAYANRWRWALAARKQRRLQWEEMVGWWGLTNIVSGADLDGGPLGMFSEEFCSTMGHEYIGFDFQLETNLNLLPILSQGLEHSVEAWLLIKLKGLL